MRTIKTLLPVLLLAPLFAVAAALQGGALPAAKNPAPAPPVPLLWKVSDADNALYLLGSFHLLKPGDYPLSPDVQAALDDAEEVVFELSPEELASPALGLQMAQAAARTDGSTLDSQIGPELADKLSRWARDNAAHLRRTGLSPEVLQLFKPWFAGLMVSVVELTKQGLDPALGLDRHFMARAAEAGKATAALETGAEQVAVFAGMHEREQLQMLAEALDQAAAGPAEIERMHRQWREGDAEGLWNGLALQLKRDYPQLYRRINVDRNDAWMPQLVERLEARDGDALVVVGALHLLGDDGVVEKLRARGYRVERICSACPAANDD
ncbi:MAG: TraB/GumN family protein [Gammaproteobacteria bacterium]